MKQLNHVTHGFPPFYEKESRILILGSFPSVKSREVSFFYGFPRNRFWQVTAELRKCAVPSSEEEKREFLHRNRIALYDVIEECDIHGSSDSSITNVIPADMKPILKKAEIRAIFVNGATASKLYDRYLEPELKVPAIRLPSTSPANAAWSLEKLEAEWKVINEYLD
ncbi:MAG: DNA-deoxyinosine glycosylase [Lachnospiraceae bacterium]|jgi:TDG/mug DNA glycosylase family protein|nr:DNA-deoxyinosine glycosylase [Lachnospiraceae bacterium]MCI1727582.1 DNA-deoxyinosine glycosylase [Lachnospiraceae bacterium]